MARGDASDASGDVNGEDGAVVWSSVSMSWPLLLLLLLLQQLLSLPLSSRTRRHAASASGESDWSVMATDRVAVLYELGHSCC